MLEAYARNKYPDVSVGKAIEKALGERDVVLAYRAVHDGVWVDQAIAKRNPVSHGQVDAVGGAGAIEEGSTHSTEEDYGRPAAPDYDEEDDERLRRAVTIAPHGGTT
jgi:hypothetical protein